MIGGTIGIILVALGYVVVRVIGWLFLAAMVVLLVMGISIAWNIGKFIVQLLIARWALMKIEGIFNLGAMSHDQMAKKRRKR